MSSNSIEDEMIYKKPINHDQDSNGTNSMHIIEVGDNGLEDEQSSMVEEDVTIAVTVWDDSEDQKIDMTAPGKVTTRGQKKQIDWELEDAASSVARAPIYRVGNLTREPSESPLAPLNSTRDSGSLYVMISWATLESMFSYWTMGDQQTHAKLLACRYMNPKLCWPSKPVFEKHKRVWVSLAFLYLMANKGNPWTDLDKMRDKAAPALHNTIYKIKKEYKLFSVKSTDEFRKATPATDENGNIKKKKKRQNGKKEEVEDELWMPLRDDLGQLILCKHKGSWQTPAQANAIRMWWKQALETLSAPKCSTGSNSARYQTVEVGELLIKLTPLGADRFRYRKCKAKGVFNHFIKIINDQKDRNGGTAKFLAIDDPVPDTYQFLSEHPFGLYRTYIKSTSHDAYMKQLLAGCFRTPNEERAIYDPVPDAATGTAPDIIDPRGVPKNIEKLIADLKPIDEEMKKRSENQTDARADGLKAVELGDRRANIKEASTGDIQTKTFVNITAEKAQLARGARKTEKASQGVVMGDSASKRCINYFGWKWTSPDHRSKTWPTIPPRDPSLPLRVMPFRENEMYNGLFIAEWLHLSAYSWGGLADPKYDGVKKESLASSSQVPENLIIGTSETNSVMTRWEKSWQKLVQTEGEILTSLGEDGSQYGGLLTITRHPFEFRAPSAAWRDKSRMGPYLHKGTYASYLHDVAIPTPEDKKNPFRYIVRRREMTPELEALTKEFRWICFQFDYDIRLQGASKVLNLPPGSVKGRNRFYPFRRMLFHKIEHDLDSALWKDMKKEAVEGLKSEYNNGTITYRKVPGQLPHEEDEEMN